MIKDVLKKQIVEETKKGTSEQEILNKVEKIDFTAMCSEINGVY